MSQRPIKVSPLMQLRLALLNQLAKLTKHKEDDVFETAAELSKWAGRDANNRGMRDPEDFVGTAENMLNAAKGSKGEGQG